MKMKKIVALLLTGMVVISLLAGCGGNPESSEGSQNDGAGGDSGSADKPFAGQSITFADTGAGDWESNLEPAIEKFEEETGATVNVELYSHSDYLEMLQVKLESGSSDYDVIGVDVPLVASYAVKEWIAPLDEYFTADEKQQFTPSSLEAGSWNDVFYAPAMNSSSQLLWYNTALLEEAGVELPESTTENRLTFEQVTQIAKEVLDKVDPDGAAGISGIAFEQVSRTYQMNQICNSLGGLNIAEDGLTAEGIINSEAWITGATWYQGLFQDGIALKGLTAEDAPDFYRAGKIVFMIGGTWVENACISDGFKDYGYAPVPAFEGYENQVGTPTGSWHFGIPVNAKNKELAAEFVKYMSLGEGNEIWVANNGDVPATIKGVEHLLESDSADERMKIAAYESANTAVPRALTPAYTEYDTIIQNTWEDIKNGADVKESLDSAVEKIERATSKYK